VSSDLIKIMIAEILEELKADHPQAFKDQIRNELRKIKKDIDEMIFEIELNNN
jgi:hypothetical protein